MLVVQVIKMGGTGRERIDCVEKREPGEQNANKTKMVDGPNYKNETYTKLDPFETWWQARTS